MKRNDFLKACGAGVCSCGVWGLLAPNSAAADDNPSKQQLDAARERFAKLLSIMRENLDDATRLKILERLGRECARDYSALFQKYRGDLQGFLAKIKTAWIERTEYDENSGILRLIGKPSPCVCPLAKAGRTPAEFCDCTLGWQKAAFSAVLGKPVTAEIEESVLRGGSRCSFRIAVR